MGSAVQSLGLGFLGALLLVQVLFFQVPTANSQLSFSTGWGHGKRSGNVPVNLAPADYRNGKANGDLCSAAYNEMAVARIQELIQEEGFRQLACRKR
ncbi:hypothetical protein BV898_01094 [Hypsibius exemplaris]|uniref:Uncharacterized protein n=1 Tax=Hypsibius exemplaris TaxID=2072580 RepID=A0A1W0XDE1_HYPEX|nr:hypothetical protein BV898_01094 [Hypsibius exemplaris]